MTECELSSPPAPWEIIRAAADTLAGLVADLDVRPWRVHRWEDSDGCVEWSVRSDEPGGRWLASEEQVAGEIYQYGIPEWIAALSPVVAESLVAWLRESADDYEACYPDCLRAADRRALDFARKINGR